MNRFDSFATAPARYEIRNREDSETRFHIWEVYDTHTADKATVARFYNAGRAERHCDEANRIYRKRMEERPWWEGEV